MDQEQAITLLLDRTASIQAEVLAIRGEVRDLRSDFADLRSDVVVNDIKRDLAEIKRDVLALQALVRDGTLATRQYTSYVENLLNAVTRRHLSAGERLD